jgi:hypothetical protein
MSVNWLPRLHRAGPSTSLDKKISASYMQLAAMVPQLPGKVKSEHRFSEVWFDIQGQAC